MAEGPARKVRKTVRSFPLRWFFLEPRGKEPKVEPNALRKGNQFIPAEFAHAFGRLSF